MCNNECSYKKVNNDFSKYKYEKIYLEFDYIYDNIISEL